MSREAAETFLNRLCVADIGENIIEDRKLRLSTRDRNGGVRHQGKQAGGLHRHRLTARVRSADEQAAAAFIELERDWDDRLPLLFQDGFQQWMASIFEHEL